MSTLNESPISAAVIDKNLKVTSVWQSYFDSISAGDVGTSWTPKISGLTQVGTPTISGVYYQNQGFTDFYVKIVPGTSTTSTAGSTTLALPFSVSADTGCFVITGTSSATGAVNASGQLIYLPGWSAITTPITISGRVYN